MMSKVNIKILIVINIFFIGVIVYVYLVRVIGKQDNVVSSSIILDRVKEITNCSDKPLDTRIQRRGHFWVLYNYVRAENRYSCSESITYTAPADYNFLDNVIPLVRSWKGPISIALFAPGYDFERTLGSIAYLRNCGEAKDLIKQFVTFHIFFNENHLPRDTALKNYPSALRSMYKDTYDCKTQAPYENKNNTILYKAAYKLTYPINVARNVARTAAQTHFVLASDIELYPTPNLITKFLKMVAENKHIFHDKIPEVFVLPVFEVLKDQSIPHNKSILQQMMRQKMAFSFHKNLCNSCHAIPKLTEWTNIEEKAELNVFLTAKRQDKYAHWEPFYIGTDQDPLFDERLTWDGLSDKMTQGYTMCLLNYDYMVLDNAFLTHKPGVKEGKVQQKNNDKLIKKTYELIKDYIKTELDQLYGKKNKCKID